MKKTIYTVLAALIFLHIWLVVNAPLAPRPDFSAFYYGASVALDANTPNTAMYDIDKMNELAPSYGITDKPMPFIYSVTAAYLLSPIALIPFTACKVVWVLFSLFLYVLAVFLCLKLLCKSLIIEGLIISLVFYPFISNQIWQQTNSLLLFLIVAAIISANKNHLILCGVFLAIATLIKLYPLSIALVFGLKNWRVTAVCALVVGLNMLLPGSFGWLKALSGVSGYLSGELASTAFRLLPLPVFCAFAALIIFTTAYAAYRSHDTNYFYLASVASLGVLLILPSVNYPQLTVAILPALYLMCHKPLLLLCFALITVSFTTTSAVMLIMWIVLVAHSSANVKSIEQNSSLP